MPALASARGEGKRISCQNNLKQLSACVQMYAADSEGKLPPNNPGGRSAEEAWVAGNMVLPQDATNQTLIRQGKLFPYANHVSLYHCPADQSQTKGALRVRSYSMNGWIGSRYMDAFLQAPKFRTFVRETELTAASPANLWLILDEHEATIDDSWFLVNMDSSPPSASLPASRHNHGYDLNFGDGHVELYRLHDADSQNLAIAEPRLSARNSDWLRLKEVTTVR